MTALCKTKILAMIIVALGSQYVERHLIAKAGTESSSSAKVTAHTAHAVDVVDAETAAHTAHIVDVVDTETAAHTAHVVVNIVARIIKSVNIFLFP